MTADQPNTSEPNQAEAVDADAPSDPMLVLVTQIGTALNRSSYPTPQIQQVLREVCTAYGYDISVEVFPSYVFAVDRGSNLVELAGTGSAFRFDQIARTEALVRQLRHGSVPIDEALAELDAIDEATPPVNVVLRILGYMLMALGFALCFRMSLAASIAAVVISIPIAAISLWSSIKGTLASLMPVGLTFVSALAIALWAIHGGTDDPVRVAVIPVLTLIPGAALTTAIIELTTGDMIAGSSRLMYAFMLLMSMAFGLALAINIVGMTSDNLADLTSQQAPSWVLWIAAPVFGIGNVLYFCTPRRDWVWIIVFCFGTFWVNQLLQHTMSAAFAGGVSLGLALLVAWALNAHLKSHPSTLVMFLPTFWLMVPGSMGFVALSGAMTDDKALSNLGGSALLSLMSMAICMMIAAVIAPMVIKPLHLTPLHLKPSELRSDRLKRKAAAHKSGRLKTGKNQPH